MHFSEKLQQVLKSFIFAQTSFSNSVAVFKSRAICTFLQISDNLQCRSSKREKLQVIMKKRDYIQNSKKCDGILNTSFYHKSAPLKTVQIETSFTKRKQR